MNRLRPLALLLLACAAAAPFAGRSAAGDDASWSIAFLAQTDSRGELRPCT